jgi:ABC-type transport system substrate-binding protein
MRSAPSVGVLALAVVTCSRQPPIARQGSALRIGQCTRIEALNPTIGVGGFSAAAHYLTFDRLVALDEPMKPRPSLLTRWETFDGGRRLRLILRSDTRFQDGQPVTADDLIFTLEEMRRPENESTYVGDLRAITRIEKVDGRTVDLELAHPSAHLIDSFEWGLLPRHLLQGRRMADASFNWHPVGAGPYRVREMQPDRLVLEANPSYFGASPGIDRLTILVYQAEELWRRLLAHHVDVAMALPWSKHRFLARLHTVKLDASARRVATALWFDSKHLPFDRAEVRRAFAAAIDRIRLVERTEFGFGVASDRLDPSEPATRDFDPEALKRLLGGRTVTLAAFEMASAEVDAAMELQRQLAAFDVDVRIAVLSAADMQAKAARGELDIRFVYLRDPQPYEDTAYHYRSNQLGPAFKDVDGLFDQIAQTADPARRRELFLRIDARVREQAPLTILYWQPILTAYRAEYCGFHMVNPFTGLEGLRRCS